MTYRQALFRFPGRAGLVTLLLVLLALLGVTGVARLGTGLAADPTGTGTSAAGMPVPVLQVRSAEGEEFLRLPLDHGLTWEIQWLHSVAGVTIRDLFAVRAGRMVLTDSFTPLLDVAGLGNMGERGELRDDGAGGNWLANIDETIPGNGYWMRIGSERAPTTIVYNGRTYPLSTNHPSILARIEVILP